tara:strand:- start:1124 stop:1990 length:867 start_codon:yes stop_codon:yes gene_type:complete
MTTWTHTSDDSDPSNPNWVRSSISPIANSYSLEFDGSEYVTFGTGGNYLYVGWFNYSDSYTVSAWVNVTSLSAERMIIAREEKTEFGSNNKGWHLSVTTDGNVDFFLGANSTTNKWKIRSSATLSVDTWYHILATHTYSDSTHSGTININGVEGHSTVLDALATSNPLQNIALQIGVREDTDLEFVGKIDEIAIWKDHALSEADALALYNNGTPTDLLLSSSYDSSGVALAGNEDGYWRFEEGTGTSVASSVPASIFPTGTITSGQGTEWVTDIPEVLTTWNTSYGGV